MQQQSTTPPATSHFRATIPAERPREAFADYPGGSEAFLKRLEKTGPDGRNIFHKLAAHSLQAEKLVGLTRLAKTYEIDLTPFVNAQDHSGQRALHYSTRAGKTAISILLADVGADWDLPDSDGITPSEIHAEIPFEINQDFDW